MIFFLINFFLFFFLCLNPASCNELSIVDNCSDLRCTSSTISDIAISNNNNFSLIAYKSNDRFVRKISTDSLEDSLITFDDLKGEAISFMIQISGDNSKALIYSKELNSSAESVFYILNLENNISKKISVNNINLNTLLLIDIHGDSLLATSSGSDDPSLFIINTLNGEIKKTFPLPDTGDVLALSPSGQDAIVLFKNILFQSLAIFDIQSEKLIRIDVPLSLIFKTDEFLEKIKFNERSTKTVLSSLDGIHILYFVDLIKNRLIIKKLNQKSTGKVLSITSKDGTYIASIGLDKQKKIATLYKIDARNIKKLKILKQVDLDSISSINDILISPDNENVFLLAENKILVFNLNDLSISCEETLESISNNKQFFSNVNSLNAFIPFADNKKLNKISVSGFCVN